MSEEYRAVRGELVCKRSDELEDWFTIERAEHDGRTWMEPVDYGGGIKGSALMMSCRITDACVEGTGEEMLSLARAIDRGSGDNFKRCAVYPCEGGFALSSPRNSTYAAVVPADVALRLAASIRLAVAPQPSKRQERRSPVREGVQTVPPKQPKASQPRAAKAPTRAELARASKQRRPSQ